MTERLTIVVCDDRSGGRASELAGSLARLPQVEVAVLPHLYDVLPDGPAMRHLKSVAGDMVVLSALYPRAAYWLLSAEGVKGRMGRVPGAADGETDAAAAEDQDLPDRTIWCLDLRTHEQSDQWLQQIGQIVAERSGQPAELDAPAGKSTAPAGEPTRVEETARPRWYPVIDFGRCANCLECLNFCLFGVFSVDGSGRLVIEDPDACRDGCPACARVCPQAAIMFPAHGNPALAGDAAATPESLGTDLIQLLGIAGAAEQAAAERDRALSEKSKTTPTADADELDSLVDELDEMDL